MIPIRDDVPTRAAPWVVAALVAGNVAVFLYEVWLAAHGGEARIAEFVDRWGLVPRELLRGLADPGATTQVAWLTPWTALFLHAGLLHLGANLLTLWIFGRSVEDLLGHLRFALFYALCGAAAAAVQVASDPAAFAPTVGASGAVAGLLGAYAVAYPTSRLRLLWPRVWVPAFSYLVLWVGLQVLSGVVGAWRDAAEPVAWWAHLGGFAAGAALARPLWVRKPTSSRLHV